MKSYRGQVVERCVEVMRHVFYKEEQHKQIENQMLKFYL